MKLLPHTETALAAHTAAKAAYMAACSTAAAAKRASLPRAEIAAAYAARAVAARAVSAALGRVHAAAHADLAEKGV